jgi:hypothetical protein
VHSKRNIGGFGRFYIGRKVAVHHPYVVFLDDDQVGGPDFIASIAAEFTPKTARGTWAFRFIGTSRYSDRVPARPGERVKYCGTGGMICDSTVFLQDAVFRCPRRFWFVEDLWLSYYVDQVLAWPMYKSGARLRIEADEQDQFHLLHPAKRKFFRYLVRRGWNPLLEDADEASARKPPEPRA